MHATREHLAAPLPSLREDLSESDLDPLPEAARDARVAYVIMPTVPSHVTRAYPYDRDLRPANIEIEVQSDEDEDLTGADESDDGDLTDYTTDYADTIDGS